MAPRSPARLLAPLALAAATLGVIVVVATSGTDTSDAVRSPARTTVTRTEQQRPQPKPRVRAYVVKPGDSLGAIAEETGVSLETLQELNPDVDPQALHVGERLKLSP